MSNATFLYDSKSDIGILSGGDWLSGQVGLKNVQNDKYWRVARSASNTLSATQIRINMLSVVEISGFALVLNNATPSALVRVSAFSDANYTSPTFISNWFGGGFSSAGKKDEERSPIISGVFSDPHDGRYWLVEIDDTTNPEGYVDVGRLFLGNALSPSFNYAFEGQGLRFKNNAISAQTLSGNTLYWRRINPRQWNCVFQYLPENEIFGSVYDFVRYVGFDREVFVIPDPDDISQSQATRFFATIVQQDALTQLAWEHGSFGFGVEEKIAIATTSNAEDIVPTNLINWFDFDPEVFASKPVLVPENAIVWEDYTPIVISGVNVQVDFDDMIMTDYSPSLGGLVITVPTDEDLLWTDYTPNEFSAFDTGFDAGFS